MVNRLFSWSADSFLVHRLVYSPLAGLSFVDLIVDGHHAFAGLVAINLTCRPLSSPTLLLAARICWTFIVVDLVVNGQNPLDLLF